MHVASVAPAPAMAAPAMAATSSARWRDDIQGLRAVAVVSVILYHLGWLPGGFVGVDVFFVISGYLISQHIYPGALAQRFSFADFYLRRARRILPLYVVVATASLMAGLVLLYPDRLADLARALAWASVFAGNVYFFRSSSYFAAPAQGNAALHLWSLGVEEQFYLLFPLLVVVAARNGAKAVTWLVACLACGSYALSVTLTHAHPTAAFYLLPFRVFEFGCGAVLALPQVSLRGGSLPGPLRQGLAAAGAVLLGLSIAGVWADADFPGAVALLPCLGAAALILAGQAQGEGAVEGRCGGPTVIGRLLALRLPRWIGRISYSLYMVHWPVIVLGGVRGASSLHAATMWPGLAALSLILVLATLTFHGVEEPMRRARLPRDWPRYWPRYWPARRWPVGLGYAVPLLALVAAGGTIAAKGGLPQRFGGLQARYLSFLTYDEAGEFRTGSCFLELDQAPSRFDAKRCLPHEAGRPLAVLWGDSTAAALAYGLAGPLHEGGWTLGQMTASGCPPTLGFEAPHRPLCRPFNDMALARLLRLRPALVLLSWAGAQTVAMPGLQGAIDALHRAGLPTLLIGVTPMFREAVPRMLADRVARGDYATGSAGETVEWVFTGDAQRRAYALTNGLGFASFIAPLCPLDDCPLTAAPGTPMQFDTLHLTREGSLRAGRVLAKQILSQAPHG